MPIKVKRSHTLTVRVTLADYQRLKAEAEIEETNLTDLLRFYISTGLRAEGREPLDKRLWVGRPIK